MSKQVRLNDPTYHDLEEWKSPGQSFDGAVQELLNKIKQSEPMEAKA